MKHYKIALWGYGGEAAYIELTKEQFEYWSKRRAEEGEEVLIDYLLASETEEDPNVPDEFDFMQHNVTTEDQYRSSWYDAPTEYCHQYGVAYDVKLSVDEMSGNEYDSKFVAEVIENVLLDELEETHEDLVDYDIARTWNGVVIENPDYVCQMWSAEKGTFFEGYVEVEGDFDISKLKIYRQEYPNGDDTIVKVTYDGNDIENNGGDTNGKGYSAHVWSNV